MITGLVVATEAKEWIGTPWQHQQHLKQVGCDCAGLVRGVAINLGLMPSDVSKWPQASNFEGYGRSPDGRMLVACDTYMTRLDQEQLQIGDVVVNGWRLAPERHLAIIVGRLYDQWVMVHADTYRGVIMERIQYDRRYFRYVQGYRLPGVEA